VKVLLLLFGAVAVLTAGAVSLADAVPSGSISPARPATVSATAQKAAQPAAISVVAPETAAITTTTAPITAAAVNAPIVTVAPVATSTAAPCTVSVARAKGGDAQIEECETAKPDSGTDATKEGLGETGDHQSGDESEGGAEGD
jgi:hypothetical protein